jgi:hypothetical protein
MPFSPETVNRLFASGRNYVSVIVGFIGGIGIMSASQSKGLVDAFNEIFNGLSMIVHGATDAWGILVVAFPIIGVLMARMASNSATTASQVQNVKNIATGPASPVAADAQKALIEATSAVALDPAIPASTEAKNTLIAATRALPEVQSVITTPVTRAAS